MEQKKIAVFGAGRSIAGLLGYLHSSLTSLGVVVRVFDVDLKNALEKVQHYPEMEAFKIENLEESQIAPIVKGSDVVISMLPAHLHLLIAKVCLTAKVHFFTASYINEDFRAIHEEVKNSGLLFLMECGLDPGIDHMSAQKEIDEIQSDGGRLMSFKSYTGGLVAPESDDNPWNYKITWNPRNVVLSGQGAVKYIKKGQYKYIPYYTLYKRLDKVHVQGYGDFEAYANRDSLKYRSIYGIDNVPTLLRGTLRRKGFCEAWNVLVQLGLTDDSYKVEVPDGFTFRDLTNTFLAFHTHFSVEDKLCLYFDLHKNSEVFQRLEWLGIFDKVPLLSGQASPAELLQSLIEEKWKLSPEDKDMIVMQHQFEYAINGNKVKRTSSMVVKGDDAENTSMAKTVGLPLGMAVSLFLKGKIKERGVVIPTHSSIYTPILNELEQHGVVFSVEEEVLT